MPFLHWLRAIIRPRAQPGNAELPDAGMQLVPLYSMNYSVCIALRLGSFTMFRMPMAVLALLAALACAARAQTVAGTQMPPASTRATPAALIVHRAGLPPVTLSAERIAALPALSDTANLGGHDAAAVDWSGPLLWDVLVAAGAVDPAKPAEQVHLVVRVTGSDGYVAVLALGEISPEFAGRKVLLANRANNGAIDAGPFRLVVPDEKRGGRSVRDVVRIDID
jgi:hypothetical protein